MHAKTVVLFLPALFGAFGWATPVPSTNAYDMRRDGAKDELKISVFLPKIVSGRGSNEAEDKDPLVMMWTKTGDEPDDDPLAMMYFKGADAPEDEDEDDPLAMMWWKPVDDNPDTIEETES